MQWALRTQCVPSHVASHCACGVCAHVRLDFTGCHNNIVSGFSATTSCPHWDGAREDQISVRTPSVPCRIHRNQPATHATCVCLCVVCFCTQLVECTLNCETRTVNERASLFQLLQRLTVGSIQPPFLVVGGPLVASLLSPILESCWGPRRS
jgi:hypothetical protein